MDQDRDNYIGMMLDNRYEILEKVGEGGMALVYKARCHRLNRFVAVKILRPPPLSHRKSGGCNAVPSEHSGGV